MAYIERAYLTEQFENLLHDDNIMNPVMKVLDALEIIDTAPSVDVEEVKHGKWTKIVVTGNGYGQAYFQHKECAINSTELYESPYERCPRCGAKMDGGNNNDL